jgi:hypothetical protein
MLGDIETQQPAPTRMNTKSTFIVIVGTVKKSIDTVGGL